jgi:predicted MFS family arabinose efflux permease
MAAGLLLPVLFSGLAAVIGSALLVGGTFVVTTMTSLQVAQEVSHGHAARLVAAMTAAFALGQIIGPVVAGLLFDAGYGFSSGLVLAGVLLLLSALLLWRAAPGKSN